MRTIKLKPFPHDVDIQDIEMLLRTRLQAGPVMYSAQAIALLGYMCSPNDNEKRRKLTAKLKTWDVGSDIAPRGIPRTHHEWLRVADVMHHYYDLHKGGHQAHRGGPSLGKAVTLVSANAKSRGTAPANLWKLWSKYRDVAPLVTAAVLVAADAKTRHFRKPFPVSLHRLHPIQMVMVVPELVVAVAREFQRFGLETTPVARSEPSLDPETLWRIPEDCKVRPLLPPARAIRHQDLQVLNERRAGNRGRGHRAEPNEPQPGSGPSATQAGAESETTPVS